MRKSYEYLLPRLTGSRTCDNMLTVLLQIIRLENGVDCMFKKMTAWVLAAALLVPVWPARAFAAGWEPDYGFTELRTQQADGGTYKIWLEDSQSLEEKLKVIKANNLAGVAEWCLGMESSGIWDLILQYVN